MATASPLTRPDQPRTLETRPEDLVKIAAEVFDQRPSWVTFFREILGATGIIRQVCDTPAKLAAFERTADFRDIQQMLARLRENDDHQPSQYEPTRVITMRLPKSLHEALKAEAHERHMSVNQLCIAKALQALDGPEPRQAGRVADAPLV